MTGKKDWRPKFIKYLRDTGNVRAAAEATRISRQAAYKAREVDEEFAALWNEALDDACDLLEAEAWRRAYQGTTKAIYQGGKLVGSVQEYSDTLLIFLLKAHRPEKFVERRDITSGGKPIAPGVYLPAIEEDGDAGGG